MVLTCLPPGQGLGAEVDALVEGVLILRHIQDHPKGAYMQNERVLKVSFLTCCKECTDFVRERRKVVVKGR